MAAPGEGPRSQDDRQQTTGPRSQDLDVPVDRDLVGPHELDGELLMGLIGHGERSQA